MNMRAVMMQTGRLWVEEQPIPEPGPGEVLVKTRACGICGSDLHATQHTDSFVATSRQAPGAFKLTTFDPVVLGHEFCAEIVDYAPHTEDPLPAGTLVCSVPVLLRDDTLSVGYSAHTPGGFAQYMRLSTRLLERVPAGLDPSHAALTEPMAVGLHAVNKARWHDTQTRPAALVIGTGPVGLAVITALNARGIGPIVAADYSPTRRALALAQGAHAVYDPGHQDPFQAPEISQSELIIFECVGVPGMLDDLFIKAPSNTQIVVVGVCLETDHIRPLVAINKELALQFVLGYSRKEFRDSLHHIAEGRFDIPRLISHEIDLDQVPATFDALSNPEHAGKVIVKPWD